MCGICGQYNFATGEPAQRAVIEKMTAMMVHRGPDDEGFYYSGPLGFGFRRLSIIDLDTGHQPMPDPDDRVWVMLNGEIYNFPELRQKLEERGYVFKTTSDTEVIVHGYNEWGMDVLDELNGMFGLAIWDDVKKVLILARDRMGIKPLYYALTNGGLFFGSEIRTILAGMGANADPDPVALSLFLQYRYTPSPLTAFRGIKKLAPGTRLVVRDGEAKVERWWRYRATPLEPMPTPEEAGEELLNLYKRAVKRQLISDVPLGILLSGGVDSALLLALMNLYGREWKTFSIGFGSGFQNDELAYARQTAEMMGSPNCPIELDRAMFEKSMPTIIRALEEPVAASSVVPMYHVCRRAREDVKVILVGQGPDELFGGYKRHLGIRYGAHWRSIPGFIRHPIAAALGRIKRKEEITRALYSLDVESRIKRYQLVFSIVPDEVTARLFKKGLLPIGASDEILNCWSDLEPMMEGSDELGGFQFLEIRSSLPDELLMYGDKLSMAHGLEARVPYLDQEVVEYVERLSASYKVRGLKRKWLHRRVAKAYLPAAITERRKLGFETPVDQWFRDSMTSGMETSLREDGSMIYGYLRAEEVKRLMEEHRSGVKNNFKILFSIAVLEEWLRNYVP
jgi:asparagine synthase (glutamine-hydrolysing)